MEYKQNIIDLVGEKNLENNFKNELLVSPVRKSIDTNEILKTYANENYIIKYISNVDHENITEEERKTISNMMPFLKEYYSLLLNSPRKYYDSELTKDDNMKGLCPPDIREKLIEKFKEYNLKEISSNAINSTANSTEKSMLMEFFCRNINTDDKSLKNAQSKYIEKMLKDNKKTAEYQRSELKFLASYINHWMANEYKNVDVYIGECKGNQNGYYTNGLFYINKISDNLTDLPAFIQFVCHLTAHSIQDQLSRANRDSKTALSWITSQLFEKYESREKYVCKKINYRLTEIEEDAEDKGFEYAEKFYDEYSLQIKFKGILERRETSSKKEKNSYDFRIGNDKKKYVKEDFIYLKLKELMENHPEEIANNLLLLHIFDKEGHLKPFLELITKDTKNIESCKSEIIDDILFYQIAEGALDRLDLRSLGENEIANLFSRLIHMIKLTEEEIVSMNSLEIDYNKVKENGYTNNNGTISYEDMYQMSKRYLLVFNTVIIYLLDNLELLKEIDLSLPEYNYSDFANTIKQLDKTMGDNLPLEQNEKDYIKVLVNTYKKELTKTKKKEA